MQSILHIRFASLWICQKQIVADGAVHQSVPLRHIDEICASRFGNVYTLVRINLHFSGLGRDKAKQKPEECRLPLARLPHDGRFASRFKVM